MARTIERTAFGPAPVPELLTGTAFMAEAGADTFVIRDLPFTPAAWEDEDEQEHAGVLAHVLRADDVAIAVDGSLDESGAAVVTLPSDCYHVPGRLSVAIYISDSEANVACVYACVGNVYRTVGGTELDSGTEVPDLTALQAAYNAAMGAAQDVEDALADLPKSVLYEPQTLAGFEKTQVEANTGLARETATLMAPPATPGYLRVTSDYLDTVIDIENPGATGTNKYKFAVDSFSAGDQLCYKGSSPNTNYGFGAFLDGDNRMLAYIPGFTSGGFTVVTAPEGTAKVVRQTRAATENGAVWYKGIPLFKRIEMLEAAVAALQPAGLLAAAPGGDDA